MVFYLCDGKVARCCQDANCRVSSVTGNCRHTVDPHHALHQNLTDEEEFKKAFEGGRFKKVKFGPTTQFWEKPEEVFE